MVSLTIKHSVKWCAPLPIWTENSSTGIRTRNEPVATYPSILRFASDNFMQELLDVMNDDPGRIADWLAQPETWREPMATPEIAKQAEPADGLSYLLERTKRQADAIRPARARPLVKPRQAPAIADAARRRNLPIKLFHSSHQRFYLVSASLVTSDYGFPDQALDLGKREKASFVLRRLVPPAGSGKIAEGEEIDLAGWDEYAFVSTPGGQRWVRLDETGKPSCRRLWPGEEQLPLFPVGYRDGCNHDRTVFSGLIPVGKREKWMGAPLGDTALLSASTSTGGAPLASVSHARRMFQTDVAEPWKILQEQAETAKQGIAVGFEEFDDGDSSDENKRTRRTLRDNIQMASWYVLLDFASFLEKFLPDLWDYVNGVDGASAPSGDRLQLYRDIRDTKLPNSVIEDLVEFDDRYLTSASTNRANRRAAAVAAGGVETSLLDAIVRIAGHRDDLETVENEFVRYHDLTRLPLGAEAFTVDPKWPDFLFPLADPRFNGPYPKRAGEAG